MIFDEDKKNKDIFFMDAVKFNGLSIQYGGIEIQTDYDRFAE